MDVERRREVEGEKPPPHQNTTPIHVCSSLLHGKNQRYVEVASVPLRSLDLYQMCAMTMPPLSSPPLPLALLTTYRDTSSNKSSTLHPTVSYRPTPRPPQRGPDLWLQHPVSTPHPSLPPSLPPSSAVPFKPGKTSDSLSSLALTSRTAISSAPSPLTFVHC